MIPRAEIPVSMSDKLIISFGTEIMPWVAQTGGAEYGYYKEL